MARSSQPCITVQDRVARRSQETLTETASSVLLLSTDLRIPFPSYLSRRWSGCFPPGKSSFARGRRLSSLRMSFSLSTECDRDFSPITPRGEYNRYKPLDSVIGNRLVRSSD